MTSPSRHQKITCTAVCFINKSTVPLSLSFPLSLLSFFFLFFFLSFSHTAAKPAEVNPVVPRPRRTAPITYAGLSQHASEFRRVFEPPPPPPQRPQPLEGPGAGTIVRRHPARNCGARDLITRTRDTFTPNRSVGADARTENGARGDGVNVHEPARLSAWLPDSCLLPACLVRRRTARGPHVVCLASGLFTC